MPKMNDAADGLWCRNVWFKFWIRVRLGFKLALATAKLTCPRRFDFKGNTGEGNAEPERIR